MPDNFTTGWVLAALLTLSLALRVWGVDFGLPALFDPDESHFMLTALKLLDQRTLNPGWFGHPGTITIYGLALVILGVLGLGLATGRFADPEAFGQAIFADPGIVVLPGRLFIVILGVISIALTYHIARKLFGKPIALLATAVLAVAPLHIKYSQVIRTDMNVTVFMLLAISASIEIVRRGRRRDYLLAGMWLGFAAATKWPGLLAAVAVAGATLARLRTHPEERTRQLVGLGLAGVTTIIAMFAASPYLLLDYQTVLSNLGGEARGRHLGSTGSGFGANLWWYLTSPLRSAVGALGLALALLGALIGATRSAAFFATVLMVFSTYLLAMSGEALVWERYVVPLLPLVAIAVAVGLAWTWRELTRRAGSRAATPLTAALALALAGPMLMSAKAGVTERRNDTRAEAARWAARNIPAGSTIIIEHLAFDMLGRGWTLLHPIGRAGCVDVFETLSGRITPDDIGALRGSSPIVDLGSFPPDKLDSCRGDYVILANFDRYLQEARLYPDEIAKYREVISGGATIAIFQPAPGRSSGRTTRVVRLESGPGTAGDEP